MCERIKDYSSVNEHFNSELREQLGYLERKVIDCESKPENQINQILHQQMKRVKARSCNNRKRNFQQTETKDVKKRIYSLKKQVKQLRKSEGKPSRIKRSSNNDYPLSFSVLKKQYEVTSKVYHEQKRRTEIQKRQILSIRNAIEDLDQKLEEGYAPDGIDSSDAKRMRALESKKRKLLEMRNQTAITFQNELKGKMGDLMDIDRSVFERENLQRKINQELNHQKVILEEMKGRGVGESENEVSDFESVREFNKKRKLTSELCNSFENVYASRSKNVPQSDKEFRTLTTENTPARKRETSMNIIMEKRRSFRTPVNLSPSKFELKDIRGQINQSTSEKLSTKAVKYPIVRKDSAVITTSQLKINESRNLDVSVTSSMYYKNKGIELLNESIVELATIQQTRKKSIIKRDSPKSRFNQSHNKSLFQKLQKQALQTTKGQMGHESRHNPFKGIPFECDEPEETSSNNNSFALTRELHGQIPKRYRNTSLKVQQQF